MVDLLAAPHRGSPALVGGQPGDDDLQPGVADCAAPHRRTHIGLPVQAATASRPTLEWTRTRRGVPAPTTAPAGGLTADGFGGSSARRTITVMLTVMELARLGS